MIKQTLYYEIFDLDYLDYNAIFDGLKLLQKTNSIYDSYYCVI